MFGCDCIFDNNETNEGVDQLLKYPWFIRNVKNVSDVITNHIDNIIITVGAYGIINCKEKHYTR